MYLGELIKRFRDENELSLQAFADKCGLSKGYIAMLERNVNSKTGEPIVPSLETFIKVSKVMSVTLDELFQQVDENQPVSLKDGAHLSECLSYNDIKSIEIRSIPVLGQIACGTPIFAEEDLSYIALQDVPKEADFALIARGDSMKNARIHDGDYVFIKKQPTVKNGEIAAVLIDNEVTLKKFYFYPDKNKVVLYPDNPDYEPLVFIGEELNGLQVLGRAIAFQSII